MTTAEFYYLMLCLGAFFAFALSLAYSTWSWQQYRGAVDAAPRAGRQVKTQAKLAA